MRRAVILAAMLAVASPALAVGPVPVVDVSANATARAHLLKTITEVSQTLSLVNMARSNLSPLSGAGGLLGFGARISGITSMLNQAQQICQTAAAQPTPAKGAAPTPAAKQCNISSQTATAQAAALGADLGQIQTIQAAANGSGGALAATQASAQATLVVASQLQQLRQAQLAETMQKQNDKQVDAAALASAKQKPTVNPWGP